MLGYKNNENYNSRYAWKLPGVNTTSELIPDNPKATSKPMPDDRCMITIWNSGHNSIDI